MVILSAGPNGKIDTNESDITTVSPPDEIKPAGDDLLYKFR
jgi:hypothetical protein